MTADLGRLDRTPIAINGEIWLIQKDGEYSFLEPDGGNLNGKRANASRIVVAKDGQDGTQTEKVFACLTDRTCHSSKLIDKYPDEDYPMIDEVCGMNSTLIPSMSYSINDQNEVVFESDRPGG